MRESQKLLRMLATRDIQMMPEAYRMSANANCARRKVGCVLVDMEGNLIGAGANMVPPGRPFCNAQPCPGAAIVGKSAGSLCEAVHAEQVALVGTRQWDRIHTCYVTSSPCLACVKLLLLTSCYRVVFDVYYPNPDAQEWWEGGGRSWIHLSDKKGEYPTGQSGNGNHVDTQDPTLNLERMPEKDDEESGTSAN